MTKPFKTNYTLEQVEKSLQDHIEARDVAISVGDLNVAHLHQEQIEAIVKFCESKAFKKKWGLE